MLLLALAYFFVSLCSYKEKYIEYSANYKKLPLKNLMMLILSSQISPILYKSKYSK